MIFAIIPVYLYRELGLSAATTGVIFGIGALGTVGGALLASPIARRVGLGRTIVRLHRARRAGHAAGCPRPA